jgi:hypothetical protein
MESLTLTGEPARFGRIGAYIPTEEEKSILVKHARVYIDYEPHSPHRDDEVIRTQAELAPLNIHDWHRREIRHWFDNNHHKELKITVPQVKVPAVTTYQREIDEPAKLRYSLTRKKKRS